jgi:hypothetical protein
MSVGEFANTTPVNFPILNRNRNANPNDHKHVAMTNVNAFVFSDPVRDLHRDTKSSG